MATKPKSTTTLTYKAAIAEIEEILERFESSEPDVDEMAKDVKRAAELIAFCKAQLHKTEQEMEGLLAAMNKPE